jgi:UDP-N-acetylmuramyl tripeptide synthase
MGIRKLFTINIAKLLIHTLRLLSSGGTNLPGKVSMKLYPELLKILSDKLKIIFITGTNGKTTTTKILTEIFDKAEIPYITNKSGANLTTGIFSSLLEASDKKGNIDSEYALFEIDEAAFNNITDYISPYMLVVTNFFRDQLDRYGELYTTVNKVREGIKKHPGTILVLNADDSLSVYTGKDIKNKTYCYGINTDIPLDTEKENSDAPYCIFCKTKYKYKVKSYGHLGHFYCDSCGYQKPETDFFIENIKNLELDYSTISITNKKNNIKNPDIRINLPGLYNIYNSLAAYSAASVLNIGNEYIIKTLGDFKNSFGRMESIRINNKNLKLILVKNPTGFNQVLNYLNQQDNNFSIAILLNDNIADGTDVSWIWDVNFEILEQLQSKITYVYASGIRAEDIALRLKYAGVYTNKLSIEKNYYNLIDNGIKCLDEKETLYILPTYTSMLDIRKILCNKYNLKEFWE